MKIPFHLSLTLLLVGLSFAYVISSNKDKDVSLEKTISVKGYAEKKITSNKAVWSANFFTRNVSLIECYRNLELDKKAIIDFLISKGVKQPEKLFSQISTNTLYKLSQYRETNEIEAYELRQNLSFESDDIAFIEDLSQSSSSLIEKGINFNSFSPQYYYTDIESLKIEMIKQASKNARERAEVFANSSGNKIGDLVSASQGIFQITAPNSEEVSDYGVFDIGSKDKVIKAVVTMEFSVK